MHRGTGVFASEQSECMGGKIIKDLRGVGDAERIQDTMETLGAVAMA